MDLELHLLANQLTMDRRLFLNVGFKKNARLLQGLSCRKRLGQKQALQRAQKFFRNILLPLCPLKWTAVYAEVEMNWTGRVDRYLFFKGS